MSDIYIKTAKGREEIETKAGGLSPAMRRVLIYIDGKRTLTDLRLLPRVEDLASTLQVLEQGGYIARLAEIYAGNGKVKTASDKSASANGVSNSMNTSVLLPRNQTDTMDSSRFGNGLSFRPLPLPNDLSKLPIARNFMINTLNHFVGAFGVTALTNRLSRCETHSDLRSHFDDWEMSLKETREGRKEIDKLRKQLLEII